jgi:thiamine biosynthesis protein ThiS
MQIKVNGAMREFSAPMSVGELAERLQLNARQVAVERNREIVPRSTYADVTLMDGDEIEIVQFIGGG